MSGMNETLFSPQTSLRLFALYNAYMRKKEILPAFLRNSELGDIRLCEQQIP